MKNLLLCLVILITVLAHSQIILEYDRMESTSAGYSTAGWLGISPTAGWSTDASVSTNTSAVIYGLGSGTSAYELDWYILPNVVLNPTRQYQLKFRLASYTFSNSTATSRGVDIGDYVEVQVSTDGGVNYINELRITGNNNARWPYTATGTIFHTANGSFTNSAGPIGDVYTAPAGVTTTGPSTVYLNLPTNISQVAFDIFARANAAGEEWWIDDIELWDISDPLPVELISFEGKSSTQGNVLIWKTASEHNTSHYIVQHSVTDEFNSIISNVPAAVNSVEELTYVATHNDFKPAINYYRLIQFDNDGKFEVFGPISIDNSNTNKKIIKLINPIGQEVNEVTTAGIYIEVYDDGTLQRIYR